MGFYRFVPGTPGDLTQGRLEMLAMDGQPQLDTARGRGSVFFHATDGGDAGSGQVWEYRPLDEDAGLLILIFESPTRLVLDGPDNITVSPRGGLLICEDGWGMNFLRGLTPDGKIFNFARNIADGKRVCRRVFQPGRQHAVREPAGGHAGAGTGRARADVRDLGAVGARGTVDNSAAL